MPTHFEVRPSTNTAYVAIQGDIRVQHPSRPRLVVVQHVCVADRTVIDTLDIASLTEASGQPAPSHVPGGLAIATMPGGKEKLFIGDYESCCVYVYDTVAKKIVHTIRGIGSEPQSESASHQSDSESDEDVMFASVICVRVSPDQKLLYVITQEDYRIAIFRTDTYEYVSQLLGERYAPQPHIVVGECDFDDQGHLLVGIGDDPEHYIARLDVVNIGKVIDTFSSYGNEAGELDFPLSVVTSADYQYVAVSDSLDQRVQIWTTKGDFVCQILLPLQDESAPSSSPLLIGINRHGELLYGRQGGLYALSMT
jgi:DNA-binding beta-propeller fold protein YncE